VIAAPLALLAAAAAGPGPVAAAAGPVRPTAAEGPRLVDVGRAVPDAALDLRYATSRNVAGRPLYPVARCLVLAPVAERLRRAAADLRARGYRLLLWDCYRPLSVQRELWRLRPDRRWVADPTRAPAHSRAAAVDASLLAGDGSPVEMPTDHDAFVAAARPGAVAGVSPAALEHRAILTRAMEAAGFHRDRGEWWHFTAPEGRGAPPLDLPLAAADGGAR
jgi:D-alanyl-D-alanine dipeptidase